MNTETETERMDQLISEYARRLDEADIDVYGLASIAYTDSDGYTTRRTLLAPEIPLDVFVDIFASFFWVYVAESGFDAEQTAELVDNILLTAIEPPTEQVEVEEEEDTPAGAEFRQLTDAFMQSMLDRFGDVKPLIGVVWNGTAGDIVCSTRSIEGLTADELPDVLAAFVVSQLASGDISAEQARNIFIQAAAQAEAQIAGLSQFTDAAPNGI